MSNELQHESTPDLWIKRFELLVLRPFDVSLIVAAVVCLFQKDWKFALFLFLVGFLVGAIGQGLPHHRHQSARELRKGWPASSDVLHDAQDGQPPEEISPSEGYEMAVACLKTTTVLALVVVATLLHFDYKWYTAAIATGLVVVGFPASSVLIVMAAGMWSNRKNLKMARQAKKR